MTVSEVLTVIIMVLHGNTNRTGDSQNPKRNWFNGRKYDRCNNTSKTLTSGLLHEKRDSHIIEKVEGNSSSCTMEESVMLKKEIKKIEKQNSAQQIRLQQLENLVKQLIQDRTSNVMPCLPPDRSDPPPATPRLVREEDTEGIVPSWTDCEDQVSDCKSEKEDALTNDLVSLMEEFDRNGRENGIIYGVTPCYSVADSDDMDLEEGTAGVYLPSEDVCANNTLVGDVYSSPLPMFITPKYQDWTLDGYDYKHAEEPQRSPQLCFTTPVLLTSNALKEAEQNLDEVDSNDGGRNFDPGRWIAGSLNPVSQSKEESSGGNILGKQNPFSNLLTWIQQTSQLNAKQHKASCKGYWPTQNQQGSLGFKKLAGFCSPDSDSVSERVHKWTQSLRLPLLSPLPESLQSDKETNVSPAFENPGLVDYSFNNNRKT